MREGRICILRSWVLPLPAQEGHGPVAQHSKLFGSLIPIDTKNVTGF